ncbi:ras-related protein Rab-4B-like [Watersipora subatra]|uniref:ras-related protein Rab-4B-like n=1 Tax=Watersipora subatra TaxID=2589382 RepID=UPI00355C5C79
MVHEKVQISHKKGDHYGGIRESYNALTNWLRDTRTLASPSIVIILVGNKKDLDAEREVTFRERADFHKKMVRKEVGYRDVCSFFLELSVMTEENIEGTYLKFAQSILAKIESGDLDPKMMGYGLQCSNAALHRFQRQQARTEKKSVTATNLLASFAE